jgi:altronate dehydratase small subunit
MVRAIVLNENDNVATLIDNGGTRGTDVQLRGEKSGSIELQQDIAFGHKVALSDFKLGDTVLKYNEVVGEATAEIKKGEHVHVHNVDSYRGRGDKLAAEQNG